MSRRDRITYENEKFNNIQYNNPSRGKQVYLISSDWINEWQKFVNKNERLKESPPGKIDNTELEKELVIEQNFNKLRINQDYHLIP